MRFYMQDKICIIIFWLYLAAKWSLGEKYGQKYAFHNLCAVAVRARKLGNNLGNVKSVNSSCRKSSPVFPVHKPAVLVTSLCTYKFTLYKIWWIPKHAKTLYCYTHYHNINKMCISDQIIYMMVMHISCHLVYLTVYFISKKL